LHIGPEADITKAVVALVCGCIGRTNKSSPIQHLPGGILVTLAHCCKTLLRKELYTTLVDKVVEKLRKEGVVLTSYGNSAGKDSTDKDPTKYKHIDPMEVMRVMPIIPSLFTPCTTWKTGSYGGKNKVKQWRFKYNIHNIGITHGDFIAAMIISGFKYTFGKENKKSPPTQISARFKAKCDWRFICY
jgi:hypothetical protein